MIFVSIFIAAVGVLAGFCWMAMRRPAVPQEDPDDSDFLENPETHPFHDFEPELSSGTAAALRAAINEKGKT